MLSLIPQLTKLGLSGHEAAVYEVLLTQSPASATTIAKKCQMSRSSVYTLLHGLIGKGLVSTTYKNTVKQFIVEDDGALEQMIKQEQEDVKTKQEVFASLRISLRDRAQTALHVPQVISFEGQAGFKKAYLAMMRQAKLHSLMYVLRDEFVWESAWAFIFQKEWHERIKRLKTEKDVQTRLLTNRSTEERKKKAWYATRKGLEHRFLPKEQVFAQFALYAVDDMVTILSFEKGNLVGIQITNQLLARNFLQMVELLWSASKK